jgi:hypothetical protein
MEYTEQQKEEIKEQYARRRRTQYLLSGAAIVLAISLGLWGGTRSHGGEAKIDPVYIGLFFAFLLFLVVFSFRNWRCPACGAMFGRSTWRMNFCPRCGVALR